MHALYIAFNDDDDYVTRDEYAARGIYSGDGSRTSSKRERARSERVGETAATATPEIACINIEGSPFSFG